MQNDRSASLEDGELDEIYLTVDKVPLSQSATIKVFPGQWHKLETPIQVRDASLCCHVVWLI